jgi:hypothetical protein
MDVEQLTEANNALDYKTAVFSTSLQSFVIPHLGCNVSKLFFSVTGVHKKASVKKEIGKVKMI